MRFSLAHIIIRSATLAVFVCGLVACSDDPAMNGAPQASIEQPTAQVTAPSDQGDVVVNNGQHGETVGVELTSWRDIPFKTVKRQSFDYSCGSAAVATLVSFTYGVPTSEKDVFEEMFAAGDQEKIRRQGFSMLDMSRYLNAHGYEAKGFKLSFKGLETYRVPIIALINNNGYNHFVVIKTMDHDRVLIGDPVTGDTQYSRDDFGKMWGGLALIVTNHATVARQAFADANEWRNTHSHVSPRDGNDAGIQQATLPPMQWQIAPTGADLLPAATVGLSTLN